MQAWKSLVDSLGGQPVYLPPRDGAKEPLFVLHDAGVSLAEPLYDTVVPVLNAIDKLSLGSIVSIEGASLLEIFPEVLATVTIAGYAITTSVFLLSLCIAGYLADALFKNVYRDTSGTQNSAYDLLIRHFGTDLII